MKMWLYRLACAIYRLFCAVWHPVKVVGAQNLPQEGPFLIYANHQSLQDPMLLSSFLPRPIHFMAKKELFDNKILAPLVTGLGAFPVSRDANDISAVRTSMQLLKNGEAVGIFPEGHRFTDGEIHAARNGISLLALRTPAPVVPARIVGTYRPWRRLTLIVGQPLMLGAPGQKCDSVALAAATERAMQALRELA